MSMSLARSEADDVDRPIDVLQVYLGAQLERVVDELGLDPMAVEVFRQLTTESLGGIASSGPVPRFSTINNDGMPLQYALSLGGGRPGVAFLTEVGVPGTPVAARIDLTRSRLHDVLGRIDLGGARDELDAALRMVLPTSFEELASWHGGIWVAIACGRQGVGLKVYVNGRRRLDDDGWRAVIRLLGRAGRARAAHEFIGAFATMSRSAQLAGVAIDLTAHGLGTIKAYARIDRWRSDLIAEILRSTGHDRSRPAVETFGRAIGAPAFGRPGSLVLSIEAAPDDGDLDVKLDACAHCRFDTEAAARAATTTLARDFAMDAVAYDKVLSIIQDEQGRPARHHAVLGLGVSHREPLRFNVYLKPELAAPAPAQVSRPMGRSRSRRWSESESAQTRATRFLVASQSPAGAWLDFALPPGPSDGWVTAYVGLALTGIVRQIDHPAGRTAIQRALTWSARAMRPDHTWGYNAFAESDADSSAWMIRFLRANGWHVPLEAGAALRSFQRPDGGFATFRDLPSGDSWLDGHADVTPVAVRALLAVDGEVTTKTSRAVAAGQTDAGRWNSFWWTTSWYATWASLDVLEQTGWAYDRVRAARWVGAAPVGSSAFERALALRCLVLLVDAVDDVRTRIAGLVKSLEADQNADGSWASVPMLRLTGSNAHVPWASVDSGRVFGDQRRIFTTSTVGAALSEAAGLPWSAPFHSRPIPSSSRTRC